MARMRPDLTEELISKLSSRAEALVYRALRDSLPTDVLVIHSLSWVYRSQDDELIEGEADFTVFFPENGYLTIEVKGGGIWHDARTGEWKSIARNGTGHAIKDPFLQARRERFAVLAQLRGHATWLKWSGTKVQTGHAVFFPEIDSADALIGPDRPREIIGVRSDLDDVVSWMRNALRFWDQGSECQPLGSLGLQLAEEILCKSIEVRPPLASILGAEEVVRIRLTDQQAKALRILGGRRRAIISGGAGTGKTLIAAEKARILARDSCKVLFVCYNRPLADALSLGMTADGGVQVVSFHQLCQMRVDQVLHETGRDLIKEAKIAFPGKDPFDVHMPFALARSSEILKEKFDAIVVDEAQDFRDEYWFALEDLLINPSTGHLFIFTDPNQAIYKRQPRFPVSDEPFYLTTNCRNTACIHSAAYQYFRGEVTEVPEIRGGPVTPLSSDKLEEQARSICREIGRLIVVEGLRPREIVVLVLGRPKNEYYRALVNQRLSRGTPWSIEVPGREAVLVDTVARFKGLEALVAFLWLPPALIDSDDREALYVGLSRAKSLLYVVGSSSVCSSVLSAAAS
jgi:hypothetical protein